MTQPLTPAGAVAARPRNRYDHMEWAGAFGDLGTLIPFVAAYIGVVGMDPTGVLLAFGLAMIASGLWYRTPVPVQPMKAAGAVAALQAAQGAIGPAAVHAAALVTGATWLLLGASGWLPRLLRLVPRVAVSALVLALGAGFLLQGLRLAQQGWVAAAVGAVLVLVLRRSRVVPAMFALLVLGGAVGAWQRPELLSQLAAAPVGWHWPAFAPAAIGWHDLAVGAVLLALPQLPLTLGNAILVLREENNRLFPERPLHEATAAKSTGLMNLVSGCVGGVPMCHGAGGLAAHVAFGARTGGALVILGSLLLALALFFGGAVQLLFQLFAPPVLGVMLFVTGAQLARGALWPGNGGERAVLLVAAALCVWNVAAGFAAGVVLGRIVQRRA